MPIELLLALRFLRGSRSEKNISLMIKICFITIAVSTFILTLIAAVMSGFERETHKKLQSIHADIIIRSADRPINFDKLSSVLKTEFSSEIQAFSPVSLAQVILVTRTNNQEYQSALILKGIDPETDMHVSSLNNMITQTHASQILTTPQGYDTATLPTSPTSAPTISAPIASNNILALNRPDTILLGAVRAEKYKLKIGDSIELLFPIQSPETKKITLESRNVTIAGLFKTGIDEFDEHIAYCSRTLIHDILDTGITEVNLKLAHPASEQSEQEVITKLKKRVSSLTVLSWKELYPALLSALALEKYAMIIILALLIILASINITALLFMFITHKQTEIALLKSVGMPLTKLTRVFTVLGMLITLTAGLTGLLLGLATTLLLRAYPLPLPQAYQAHYISYLPVHIDAKIILGIFLLLLALSILVTILPARKIKNMSILAGLRRT